MTADGTLAPERPTRCAVSDGVEPCRVCYKDEHPRKTGPGHPLRVFECVVHGIYFSVYPPGYTPHGRQAVVSVMPDGAVPEDDEAGTGDAVPPLLEGTLPGVAWEARDKDTWRETCQRPVAPWRTTQVRRLDRVTHLVGVAKDVGPKEQLSCAEALAIHALRLQEGQAMIRSRSGVVARAQAVMHVLEEVVRVGRSIIDRLMVAGYLAGLWGRPFRWYQPTRTLIPLAAT